MDTEELAQLGPTDASIVVLAMRLDTVVLTEDGSLKDRCNRRQIPVLDYGKVLPVGSGAETQMTAHRFPERTGQKTGCDASFLT